MDSKGSDHMTKLKRFTCSAVLAAMPLLAQAGFSGKWELNPSKSKNIGMMSQMKLIATIQQTTDDLIIGNATTFNDKQSMSEIRLNFAGKPVTNKNPMEAPAEPFRAPMGALPEHSRLRAAERRALRQGRMGVRSRARSRAIRSYSASATVRTAIRRARIRAWRTVLPKRRPRPARSPIASLPKAARTLPAFRRSARPR